MSALEALDLDHASPAPSVPPATERLAAGLYERHSKRILGFCIRRLATREEAEDAVQTTFLYAIRALQRGVAPVSETAWLFKIAENVCLATHRSNGRRRARELTESPPDIEDTSRGSELGNDTARELVRALGSIPETQRKAFLLREWRGLSYREIAVELGVTLASVETLIFRARRGVVRALNGETNVKRRLAGVLNLGTLVNAFKAVFGGGAAAAKLVAAAAVVTVVALPAGDQPRARSTTGAPVSRAPVAALSSGSKSPAAALGSRAKARPAKARTPIAKAAITAGKIASKHPTAGARAASPAKVESQGAGASAVPSPPAEPSAHTARTRPRVRVRHLPPVRVRHLPPVRVPHVPPVHVPPVNVPSRPHTPRRPNLPDLPELPVQVPAPPSLPQLP